MANCIHSGKTGWFSKLAKTTAITIQIFLGTSFASEPVAIFGVPIGGKLEYQIPICKTAKNITPICWKSKPKKYGDFISGEIKFADQNSLPLWADHSLISMTIGTDRTIYDIKVKNFATTESSRSAIDRSITARFGLPDHRYKKSGDSTATWDKDTFEIHVMCLESNNCTTEFRMKPSKREREKQQEARATAEKSRPETP